MGFIFIYIFKHCLINKKRYRLLFVVEVGDGLYIVDYKINKSRFVFYCMMVWMDKRSLIKNMDRSSS